MQGEYASRYLEAEEVHWWFVGRRDMIRRLVHALDRNLSVLEVGCSGGPLVVQLEKDGFRDVRGIDVSPEAVRVCRSKGLDNVACADARETGLADASMGLLIASDVLEHIDDESAVLAEWHRVLRPEGILLVFVPAFGFLWGPHDEANRHYRRYSRRQLAEALRENGFRVQQSSYWGLSLFPVLGIVRLLEKLLGKSLKSVSEVRRPRTVFSVFFQKLLLCENALLERAVSFPFGASVFAVARRS
ncbi:MAG: class I SAM-dependent methyltransferase [Thermodesulfovibrionales bacterium]